MEKAFDDELVEELKIEIKECLANIRDGIKNFYNENIQTNKLEDIWKYIGTIKDICELIGLNEVSKLITAVEKSLEKTIVGELQVNDACENLSLDAINCVNACLDSTLYNNADRNENLNEVSRLLNAFQELMDLNTQKNDGYPVNEDLINEIEKLSKSQEKLEKISENNKVYINKKSIKETDLSLSYKNKILSCLEDQNSNSSLSKDKEIDNCKKNERELKNQSKPKKTIQYNHENIKKNNPVDNINKDESFDTNEKDIAVKYNIAENENISVPQSVESEQLEVLLDIIDNEIPNTYQSHSSGDSNEVAIQCKRVKATYLQFITGGMLYAIELSNVLEIDRVPHITPIPNVPRWLLGLVNLRSEIVSSIDLSIYFELDTTKPLIDRRMVVVKIEKKEISTALIVDEIKGFVDIELNEIAPSTVTLHEKIQSHVKYVGKYEDKILAIIDLEHFLLSPDMQQFDRRV